MWSKKAILLQIPLLSDESCHSFFFAAFAMICQDFFYSICHGLPIKVVIWYIFNTIFFPKIS